MHNLLKEGEGRYILIDISMLNRRFSLAYVYAPNSGDFPEIFNT